MYEDGYGGKYIGCSKHGAYTLDNPPETRLFSENVKFEYLSTITNPRVLEGMACYPFRGPRTIGTLNIVTGA